MTENKSTQAGTYSRKRLAFVAGAWLLVGAVAFAVGSPFGAGAQDAAGCESPPCAFPAESNVGGIVLGTDFISGEGLIAFGVGRDPPYTADTPPGSVEPEENQIVLGLNDIDAGQFFIYKSFHYFEPRLNDDVPVYIWANATEARLRGSADECGDGSRGLGGADNCDLQAGTSEISTQNLFAEADCDGITCSIVPGSIEDDEFWAVRPEDDVCGALGALGGDICLGLVRDGGTSAAGATITADTVEAEDFMIRGHEYKAVRGSDGEDKTMSLDDVYVEMRYGVGDDRINTPESEQNPGDWAQPTFGSFGEAAIANNFLCQGGGPLTFCAIPAERQVDQPGISYGNPYVPEE